MQGKSGVWKQVLPCNSQKKSPPNSHSVPKHAPPTRVVRELVEVEDMREVAAREPWEPREVEVVEADV